MGIYIYEESKLIVCDFCGNTWDEAAQMYSCDDCGKVMCEECKPRLLDEDCPNEFCEECVQ